MKIRPVGAELFHADEQTDGQTDMTKLVVAFRNVANAPKTYALCQGKDKQQHRRIFSKTNVLNIPTPNNHKSQRTPIGTALTIKTKMTQNSKRSFNTF